MVAAFVEIMFLILQFVPAGHDWQGEPRNDPLLLPAFDRQGENRSV